jgi:hypothetical protein
MSEAQLQQMGAPDVDGRHIIALARQLGIAGIRDPGSRAPDRADPVIDLARTMGRARAKFDEYGCLFSFDLSRDDDGRATAFLARAIGLSCVKPLSKAERAAMGDGAAGRGASARPA